MSGEPIKDPMPNPFVAQNGQSTRERSVRVASDGTVLTSGNQNNRNPTGPTSAIDTIISWIKTIITWITLFFRSLFSPGNPGNNPSSGRQSISMRRPPRGGGGSRPNIPFGCGGGT
eukprot:GHVT01078404.1.p1 GENE.GHVT01078404.1~~GHVT01078404.1.p1  ORF type:complete len:116 (+),score=6.28 GHVT01078404.1:333-680(+)